MKIKNARELQSTMKSEPEFFQKYGFILMKFPSDVLSWNTDPLNEDNDITNFYHAEVEEMLLRLYPMKEEPPKKKKKKDKEPEYGQLSWLEQNSSVITRGDKM